MCVEMFGEFRRGGRLRRFALILLVAGVAVLVGAPEVMAGQKEAPYQQVVDNETEGRFEADDRWGTSAYGRGVEENNYRFARPTQDAADTPTNAQFRVEIPEAGNYAVYARWPNVKGGNDAAQVGVETTSGTQWTQVNQQQDGGKWVRLGVFEMQAGDDYLVFFSRQTDGEGYVIADAVKAEWDSPVAASTEEAVTESSESAGARVSESRAPESRSGKDVVREARKWIGVDYRLGGQTRRGVDCSGLTMMVFKRFGVSLPHWDDKQYRMGEKVPKGEEKPGDLVFFNEHNRGISHVGIYSGNGNVVQASDYFGEVTESKMKYIDGYVGARRMPTDGRSAGRSAEAEAQSKSQDDSVAAPETEEASSPAPEAPSFTDRATDQVSPSSDGGASREAENEQPVQAEATEPQAQETQSVRQPRPSDAKKKTAPSGAKATLKAGERRAQKTAQAGSTRSRAPAGEARQR